MSLIFLAIKKAAEARKANTTDAADTATALEKTTEPAPAGAALAASTGKAAESTRPRVERRKHRRVAVKLAARLRPASFSDGPFEEVVSTVNASKAGLYFTTPNNHYRLRMPLHVVFPYSAQDTHAVSEASAEVGRIESLPRGMTGVAVMLRGSASASVPSIPGFSTERTVRTTRTGKERRHATRYPFSATATIIDPQSQTRLQARCSDLSLEGCYVDTLNPFCEGSIVKVRLCREGQVFETSAIVHTSHVGMGMGLYFRETPPDHKSILLGWLTGDRADAVSAG